ncbi:MAG: hypothetical protein AAFU67_17195, partial [Bacteroidota bacterium]
AFLRPQTQSKLLIHFLNYSLKSEFYQKYFPNDHFVVEEKFELPRALQRALGLGEGSFYLQPGHYTTHNDGIYHTITISLGKNTERSICSD